MTTWTKHLTMAFAVFALAGSAACGPQPEDGVTCMDGVENGDETDVDCGGSCTACLDSKACAVDDDCASGACQDGICVARSTCSDGATNGDETDVDCGGSCGACADGKACAGDGDCASALCQDGTCVAPPTCADGTKNGDETDVDCGGSCPACAPGELCESAGDCTTGLCEQGTCQAAPTCTDQTMNGDETDTDCGGSCDPCADGSSCLDGADCASGLCQDLTCAPAPTCDDDVKNGDESDVDCGGSCAACPDGLTCNGNDDCVNGLCTDGLCDPGVEPCADGVRNGDETDIDCGGSCEKCADGFACNTAADCAGGGFIGLPTCENGVCGGLDSCIDGAKTGHETDVDCGGVFCRPCGAELACYLNGDCLSGTCDAGLCTALATSCDNGVQDGIETDVDCGGACDPCPDGFYCDYHADCEWQECIDGACSPDYACTDEMVDGHETDVDCGGGVCLPCRQDQACAVDTDCASGTCTDGVCVGVAATCGNGVQDGTETDVDCGGRGCDLCETGKACTEDLDCATGYCNAGTCEMTISAMQSADASVSCASSGVVTVDTGLRIAGVFVASPAVDLDATTEGYYVEQARMTWPSFNDPSYTGVFVVVDKAVTAALADPLAVGSQVTLVGDWEEHDCETVLRITEATGSITVGFSGMALPATVAATPFENGGGADAEAYEGVLVKLSGVTVTDATGFSGTEGPGTPRWWFKVGADIYVANDYGLTLSVSDGQTLTTLTGAVKYSHGVYELVPRTDGDVVLSP